LQIAGKRGAGKHLSYLKSQEISQITNMTFALRNRAWQTMLLLVTLFAGLDGSAAVDTVSSATSLDRGFILLYNLDFAKAHQVFLSWQQEHPDDPFGSVCDAAGFLFSEFNRLGVLESQFYVDDKAFDARKKLAPDSAVRDHFYAALDQADSRARSRLMKDPQDRDALFALTLSSGLKADYAALIEKRNLASLHYTKEATAWAEHCWLWIRNAMTPILPPASANILSAAWRRRYAGWCGWEAFPVTSKKESRNCN
jgi:hypothetical protein